MNITKKFAFFLFMPVLWTSAVMAEIPFRETNGFLSSVSLNGGVLTCEGNVESWEKKPITGFWVEYAGISEYFPYQPISKNQNFTLVVKVDKKAEGALSNSLIKVIPTIEGMSGQPLFQYYNPNIPVPTAAEADLIGGAYSAVGLHFLNIMVGRCGLKKTDHVLDVGCGLGRMAYPLAYYLDPKAGYEGFDVYKKLIQIAKKLIGPYRPDFHFTHVNVYNKHYNPNGNIIGSNLTFPYSKNSFDFLFLTSVFTHMLDKDLKRYLSEIYRVLKPESKALITYFGLNEESRKSLNMPYYKTEGECYVAFPNDPERVVAYEQDTLFRWIKENGFRIVAVYPGNWCGRSSTVSYQDIVIIEKLLNK